MEIALKVAPIFILIALGVAGKRLGLFPPGLVAPANRLAYYLAIPALLFRAISRAPMDTALQPGAAAVGVAAQLMVWGVALVLVRVLAPAGRVPPAARAAGVHCSVHGNQGLVGLAVVSFALGEAGMGAAGMIATAIIVTQNLMGVVTLTRMGDKGGTGRSLAAALAQNPIIWATLAGLGVAGAGLALPEFVDRTLALLAGMGVPLALMIVGAKLAEVRLGGGWVRLGGLAAIKLMVMPALGLGLAGLMGITGLPLMVTALLLASPTASLAVVLAGELGGDAGLASQAVSLTHALCALTYPFWLVWLAA